MILEKNDLDKSFQFLSVDAFKYKRFYPRTKTADLAGVSKGEVIDELFILSNVCLTLKSK